ncbi:MAG: DUF1697 domain-containing protein [Liquorilactobacillus hordei]
MEPYVIYLRGINVGGKNKIKMIALRAALTAAGFEQVRTYIQSGNIALLSSLPKEKVRTKIEQLLAQKFVLDSELIQVLVLNASLYQAIIAEKPDTFGVKFKDRDYRYEILFPIAVTPDELLEELVVREGVDRVWKGTHALYFRRPGPAHPDYSKTALARIVKKPIYQSITVRNYRTAMKMSEILQALSSR